MLKLIKEKLHSGMGKDVVWTFTLQIVIMLCSFAVNKLLSNRLSIDDFGQYNVIKRSVQVLSFVMLAGVGIALPRYIPLYRNGEEQRRILPLLTASLIYIVGVSLVVVLLCIVFSGPMQHLIIGQRGDTALYAIAITYAFVLALAQYAYAYYRGIGDFMWYNGSQLAVQLAIILPLVLLPVLTVQQVFTSWLLITLLLVAYYLSRELWHKRFFHSLRRQHIFHFSLSPLPLSTIAKYSSGRLVADFFLFSLSAFPLVYISNTQGLQPTAYYSVGITFVTMVTPVFSFMGIILLPYVSQAIAKNEVRSADRLVSRLALLYIVASVLITLLMYVFIRFLTLLFFAESYVAAADLSRIMILSILPQALYLLYRNPIDAVSVVPYNTIILAVCLVTMVVTFLLSSTVTQFAWCYLAVSVLQGALSFLTWQIVKRREIQRIFC